MAITLLLFVTHFYISFERTLDQEVNKGGSFIALDPIISTSGFSVYPTSYFINKWVSYNALKEKPLTGIGLSTQEEYACKLQQKGQFPEYFTCLDSHCTYTGLVGETGIIGGIGLIILLLTVIRNARNILNLPSSNKKDTLFARSIVFILILIFFEGWTMETYTFRHHWVVLGMFSGYVS